MSQTAFKSLLEQGKVMLPREDIRETAPTQCYSRTIRGDKLEGRSALLDQDSPVTLDTKLYPALVPQNSSGVALDIGPFKIMGDPSDHSSSANPYCSLPHDENSEEMRKFGQLAECHADARQSRSRINCLSPIHEEQLEDYELVKSEPLLAVSDIQLEPLTPSTSNGSTDRFIPYQLPQSFQMNPLYVPNFYPQQQFRTMARGRSQSLVNKPYKTKEIPYIMSSNQPSNLSPNQSSHCHTGYKRLSSSDFEIRAGHITDTIIQQPLLFSYNKPYVLSNCHLRSCNVPTTSVNVSTCMCPRCGAFSVVRYCSIAHLHVDLLRHYIEDCNRRPNMLALICTGTVEPFTRQVRPFISVSKSEDDSLERHRQAVYRSYPPYPTADYYIFDDADLLISGEQRAFIRSPAVLSKYRGRGKVIVSITMRNNSIIKVQFAASLEILLAMGVAAGRSAPDKCKLVFNWIKVNLESADNWNEETMNRVALAMQLEFGYKVPLRLFED